MNSHYSNCEHTIRIMLARIHNDKAFSIVGADWLEIVSRTQPCIDCLSFLDSKAQEHDRRLWVDELKKRLDYIVEQRSYKR